MGTKTQKLSNVVDQIVEWQSVFTGDGSTGLTAVAGRGYFIDTTSGTVTVTTPASPKQGDKITIVDYAGTFATNNVTINFNGAKVFGASNTGTLATNFQVIDLIYIDSTQGWRTVNQDTTSDIQTQAFVAATGGTVTESGDYKIHTFTGDGCFVVSCVGNAAGSNSVSYLVVAGGGGGGGNRAGGGGAGGYREGKCTSDPYSASPLNAPAGLPVSATTYPITVGGGGAGQPGPVNQSSGCAGSNSVFSTITSAGGGAGRDDDSPKPGNPATNGGSGGGAGGGANAANIGGDGNTPPVSPPQGNNGGGASQCDSSGNQGAGGGGAGAVGVSNTGTPTLGAGGIGVASSITGTPVYRAGGGGAGGVSGKSPAPGGTGGGGDGGTFPTPTTGRAGTANTGGGGGGGACGAPTGGAGGSGIVIIRYKFQ